MPIEIRSVENPTEFNAFLEFPWTLYQHDPNWTPPLLSMRRDTLDTKKNAAWEYMEGQYFNAWRDGQLVGTIAAFINHRHNEFHSENVGWFGAFEAYDDADVAQALLDTATDWVRVRGCTAIRGPQTFTTHEEVGLLIDGFAPPVLLMPYHPPYYQALIEQNGFTKAMDFASFYYNWDLMAANNLEERFDRIVGRMVQRNSVTIRPINRKNLRADFALFKELYNKAWAANWGFVPMTNKELDALIEGLGLIFDPDLACFAEVNGEPAGFLIVVPDLNQALHKARAHPRVPEFLTLLKVAWHWKVRGVIDGSRVPLMGVVEAHRKKGVDLAMQHYAMNALREKGYRYVDCGWILESNHDMMSILKSFGMQIHRTYRMYEKRLIR